MHRFTLYIVFLAAGFLATVATAQDNAGNLGPALRIVVTAEGQHNTHPPVLKQGDVTISESNRRLRVTDLMPVQNAPGGLQLWVLIDDGTDTNLGNQFDDLRKFLLGQPSTTRIGLGYLRNGSVAAVAPLTTDHSAASKAIRLPLGDPGISASPYLALIDIVKKWPPSEAAREVLMITSGIDPYYGAGPDNPYLLRAIDACRRAAVVVHSIYYGSAGHAGHSYWRINWGQNYLSQLADETGGEFYRQGDFNPVSIAPYLKQLSDRLNQQYLVTFVAPARSKPGFERIKLTTEVPNVSLVGPSKIYVR